MAQALRASGWEHKAEQPPSSHNDTETHTPARQSFAVAVVARSPARRGSEQERRRRERRQHRRRPVVPAGREDTHAPGSAVKNCWIWWIYVTYRCPAQVETLLDLVLGWNALRASVLQSGLHVRTCRIADEDEIFFRWPMIPRARLGARR